MLNFIKRVMFPNPIANSYRAQALRHIYIAENALEGSPNQNKAYTQAREYFRQENRERKHNSVAIGTIRRDVR